MASIPSWEESSGKEDPAEEIPGLVPNLIDFPRAVSSAPAYGFRRLHERKTSLFAWIQDTRSAAGWWKGTQEIPETGFLAPWSKPFLFRFFP